MGSSKQLVMKSLVQMGGIPFIDVNSIDVGAPVGKGRVQKTEFRLTGLMVADKRADGADHEIKDFLGSFNPFLVRGLPPMDAPSR